jgi:hypothetical protein
MTASAITMPSKRVSTPLDATKLRHDLGDFSAAPLSTAGAVSVIVDLSFEVSLVCGA